MNNKIIPLLIYYFHHHLIFPLNGVSIVIIGYNEVSVIANKLHSPIYFAITCVCTVYLHIN